MKSLSLYILLTISVCILGCRAAQAKRGYCKQNKCKVVLPESMVRVHDTIGTTGDEVYYDTNSDLVLIISERKTNYKSVTEYIDCSQKDLEQLLRTAYGDTTLTLLDCRKSDLYAGNSSTIIHFYTASSTNGFNSYMVYFVHNKREDIQVSFTYKKEAEQKDIACIQNIMGSLKLNK